MIFLKSSSLFEKKLPSFIKLAKIESTADEKLVFYDSSKNSFVIKPTQKGEFQVKMWFENEFGFEKIVEMKVEVESVEIAKNGISNN